MGFRNLLAIETSSPSCIVAAGNSNGDFVERHSDSILSHNEELLTLIDSALDELELAVKDLDGVVIGQGPGSFTGLRIGYAHLMGFMTVNQLPVYPISSLLAFALPALSQHNTVLVLADARRKQYFSAIYSSDQRVYRLLESESIRSQEEVEDLVSLYSVKTDFKVVVIGDVECGLSKEFRYNPESVGKSVLDYVVREVPPTDFIKGRSVFNLEPSYLRSVAAKTIAERSV